MHTLYRPLIVAATIGLAGCTGRPTASEQDARRQLADVAQVYRPGDARPALPTLGPDATLADLLRYAMLNHPRVEAAYYDWAASIERITPARSLPDPRLTFEADISDIVQTVMPGLMIDLPGPGKLRAAGDVAAAEARVGYHGFESQVLAAAYAVKSAYYRLHFLEETLRVQRQTVVLLDDLESLAQQQVAAGRGTIQDVLRAQVERDQIQTQLENLQDSRSVLEAELASALGLPPGTTPPLPRVFEPSPPPPSTEEILAQAARRNPRLRQMQADIRQAQAMMEMARASRMPDFSVGLMSDLKASPVMWRPTASVTLPIWRDRIAAQIAEAQAQTRAAEARLSAEQIELAAELASMLYLHRESQRNTALYESTLLPKARQMLDAGRSAYAAGRASFLDLIDAERRLLTFELSLVEARTERELSLASLSLLIAGSAPAGAPLLEEASVVTTTTNLENKP